MSWIKYLFGVVLPERAARMIIYGLFEKKGNAFWLACYKTEKTVKFPPVTLDINLSSVKMNIFESKLRKKHELRTLSDWFSRYSQKKSLRYDTPYNRCGFASVRTFLGLYRKLVDHRGSRRGLGEPLEGQ